MENVPEHEVNAPNELVEDVGSESVEDVDFNLRHQAAGGAGRRS